MTNIADRFNQLGVINTKQQAPAPIPPPPPGSEVESKLQKQADEMNERRDMNRTHAFEYWVAYQDQLNDFGNYRKTGRVPLYENFNNDLHTSVINKMKAASNFYGSDAPQDFTNWTQAELFYYSDFSSFLGINFKKIGQDIGHAFGWVGHEVGDAGKWVGHEAGNAGKWIGGEVVDAGHFLRDNPVSKTVEHGVGYAAGRIGQSEKWWHHEEDKFGRATQHELHQIGVAIEPYWKIIAVVGLVVLSIASFGLAAPVAISMGAALLTGLDAIKDPTPPLPIGPGGDMGGGADSTDFPQGGPGGDGDGAPTPEQLAAMQAQQEAAQAEYDKAVAKHHKLILIAAGIGIVALIVGIIIWRHKHKKK